MSGIYDLDDAVPLVYTISAPATVSLTVTKPDGTTTSPSLTPSGAGPTTYTGAVLVDQAGTWRYRFLATGAVTDSESGHFYVQAAVAANVYTTLPELKAALSLPPSDTADDDDLQDAINVASRAVAGDCQRNFHKITETRTLVARDAYLLRLGPFNDLVSITILKTDATGDGVFEATWTAGQYQLLCADRTPNVNAGPEPRPYEYVKALGGQMFPGGLGFPWFAWQGRNDRVEITGTWGWPAIPDRIRRAARMAAAEVFKLRDAPLGAMGFADLGIIRVRENPKYQALIRDYRLVEAAVPMA